MFLVPFLCHPGLEKAAKSTKVGEYSSLSCFIAYSLYHELALLCTFVDMAVRILGHCLETLHNIWYRIFNVIYCVMQQQWWKWFSMWWELFCKWLWWFMDQVMASVVCLIPRVNHGTLISLPQNHVSQWFKCIFSILRAVVEFHKLSWLIIEVIHFSR